MAQGDGLGISWRKQPGGKLVFPGARARCAKSFKYRTGAKEVQIGGIRVVVIEVRKTGRPGSLPPTV
jgi:hypothetical protein